MEELDLAAFEAAFAREFGIGTIEQGTPQAGRRSAKDRKAAEIARGVRGVAPVGSGMIVKGRA